MKSLFSCLGILGLSVPLIAGPTDEIESLFVGYMDAALNRNGKHVAEVMSPETLDWWTKLITQSRTLDKSEILALPIYDAQSILVLRLRLSPAERRTWDGRTYVEQSYNNGWNSSQALKQIRSVFSECEKTWKIESDSAYLTLTYRGQPVRGGFRFIKASGSWKIDGIDHAKLIEERMQETMKSSGFSKEHFIERVIARIAGGVVPAELWKSGESM